MSSTLNLNDIRMQIEQLASQINAPKDLLPMYGISGRDGHPHIKVNGSFFDYWILERDEVIEHRTAFTLDDLFYWVFQDVTFQMASSYEVAHRNPKADFRRMLFDYQLQLLEVLNPTWKEKQQLEIDDILKRNPFVDQE